MAESYFEQRCLQLLGARETARLFSAPPEPFRGVTVNTCRLSAEAFAASPPFPVQPGGFAPQNFRLTDAAVRPGLHPWYHAGVYYVQEPSASGAAWALRPRPGDRVLDLCAAPGGKSAQLAAMLEGKGVLVSNEIDRQRCQVLLSSLERMGVTNAAVLNETPQRIAAAMPDWFDCVLADAPCSGEGMFRKEPQAMAQHSPALVEHCAALQSGILDAAAECLAPGGVLVYSTCTFSPQEDEGQVGAFLRRHPDFALEDTGLAFGCAGHESHCCCGPVEVQKLRRIYPCHGGEGHFIARLRKVGQSTRGPAAAVRSRAAPAAVREFLSEYFPQLAQAPVLLEGERVLLAPAEELPMGGLHALRCGVLAGTLEKDRFLPAHHLFKAYGELCANAERLSAGDPRTAAYLRGEELDSADARKGWCAVLCDGFALGMGKMSGGKVKNHYPKGLRNLK